MRIIVRSEVNPQWEVEMTDRLVAAIAEELWRLYGGDSTAAEHHLRGIVAETSAEGGTFGVVAESPVGQPQRIEREPVSRKRRDVRVVADPCWKPYRPGARRGSAEGTAEPMGAG